MINGSAAQMRGLCFGSCCWHLSRSSVNLSFSISSLYDTNRNTHTHLESRADNTILQFLSKCMLFNSSHEPIQLVMVYQEYMLYFPGLLVIKYLRHSFVERI